jgi:transposase-like protein
MQKKLSIRHTSKIERVALIGAYYRSGLTQKQFARANKIGFSTLTAWLRKAKNQAKARPKQVQFMALPNVMESSPGLATYRLRFPRGLVLEVGPGFQVQELHSLAQLLISL